MRIPGDDPILARVGVRDAAGMTPSLDDPFDRDLVEFRLSASVPTGVSRVHADGTAQLLVKFAGCGPSGADQMYATGLTVDAVNGKLLLHVAGGNTNPELVEVSGLPTLLDIIVTFQPAAGTVSWTTPRFPMGLTGAGRFEVFAGNVRDLPTWSIAEQVSCDLPGGGAPQPGQYISIADPLQNPPVGEARYVVVGVEKSGQRRFGRQQIDAMTSGRNPEAFPACQ